MYRKVPKDEKNDAGYPDRPEGQQFDKVFRQKMPFILPGIMEKVFGLHIVEFVELKDKLQTTKQLEVDAVRKVKDSEGNIYIAHLEVQTTNDPKMAARLVEYRGMFYRIYGLPVRQFVLYLGQEALSMADHIHDQPNLQFKFPLIPFYTLPHEWFLHSENPEEQMLAILGNLGQEEPVNVVEKILTSIDQQPTDVGTKNKYFNQLRIIIQLRTFTQIKMMEETMLRVASFFKEEKDPFYKRGEEKGAEKERDRAQKEIAKLQARAEKKAEADKMESARKMKKAGLSLAQISNFTSLPLDIVEKL